ncbi:jmjC domain-containing protein 8 isoform X2 [Zootoca vivipara]|uniref:jmjC domain-containing protein 8 isoform X2 n=1 Tax=Zootoca vivipara TaxID=8524 RepID=UPI001590325A|nr:jmjC domain-containing protein 8 isoform X2 [Zootoca vivipara]
MGPRGQRFLLFPFLMIFLLPGYLAMLDTDGGWLTSSRSVLMEEDSCTVERRDATLTYSQFIEQYAFSRPVILQGITDNSEFQAQCTKDKLLTRFGDRPVRLSTANTYSYHKVDLPFQEYVDQLLEPQDQTSLGSETLYFFGDNNFTEWGPLFQKYTPPPFRIPGTTGAYSFGIAGPVLPRPMVACYLESGYQRFHLHVPGLADLLGGSSLAFLPLLLRWGTKKQDLSTTFGESGASDGGTIPVSHWITAQN